VPAEGPPGKKATKDIFRRGLKSLERVPGSPMAWREKAVL